MAGLSGLSRLLLLLLLLMLLTTTCKEAFSTVFMQVVVVDINDVVDVDDGHLQGGLLSSLLGSHQAGKPSALVQLSVLHVI